jgi:CheY-like chemotaxis protein
MVVGRLTTCFCMWQTDPRGYSKMQLLMAKKILVVDDEQLIADTLTRILSGSGFEATAAYSAAEALAVIRDSGCPDILLSDVMMPGLNGIELAKQIRDACTHTEVTLITGNSHTPDLLRKAEGEGYRFKMLPKPIHPRTLLAYLNA